MPIIGHTLAGIAIAQQSEPVGGAFARGPVARALWMPLIVAISYLPDIVTQVALWWTTSAWAQAAGHSIPIGLLGGVVVGCVWAAAIGAPAPRLIAISAATIVLHDAMDLLQDSERMPFWPLSMRQIGVDWLAEPNRLWGEVLAFGIPFVLFEVWRAGRGAGPAASAPRAHRGLVWLGRGLVVGMLLAALAVIHLRDEREQEMEEARDLRRLGRFTEALAVLDQAERWPSSPGAGDILRGETYEGMGDRANAEAAFQRAYQRNPDDFWPVALLARHHASYGSREERRDRSAPFVERLRREFADHPALSRVLVQIERRRLAAPPG